MMALVCLLFKQLSHNCLSHKRTEITPERLFLLLQAEKQPDAHSLKLRRATSEPGQWSSVPSPRHRLSKEQSPSTQPRLSPPA